jgi:hypothetical protein
MGRCSEAAVRVNAVNESDMLGNKNRAKRKNGLKQAPRKCEKSKKIDGIDASLHSKIVKRIGNPRCRKRRINTRLAYKMHEAGWSYPQIGAYFKVSGCTVRRRLREAGLR